MFLGTTMLKSRLFRKRLLLSLLILTPLGFYTKFYQGPAAFWIANSFGGVLYEIFWILLIQMCRPTASPLRIGIFVFAATSGLEFLQLWHPEFLEAVRANFLGRTLIGTSFTWSDFLYYAVGCSLGVFWLFCLRKSVEPSETGSGISR